jgi:membrane protein DedA with SNARE-associated domain
MDALIKTLQDFWAGLVVGQLQPLGNWNYLLLALLVVVEGPIATLLGAVAASSGLLRPVPVFFAAATGNLTSDALWYLLGYLGKTDWLLHHGYRLGLRDKHVARFEREMHTNGTKILLLAKLTLSFSIPAMVGAGIARMPWRRWLTTVATAEIVWTGSLVLIGYHLTLSLKRLEAGVQIVAIVGIVIFLIFAIRYLMRFGARLQSPPDQPKS